MSQMADPIPEVPVAHSETSPLGPIPVTGMPLNLEPGHELNAFWLIETARNIGTSCRSARDYSAGLLSGTREKTREFTARLRDRAERVKEEPLTILAVIAGAAAVAGVASRVWRSSRYE
ncbi:MAG: hypothetical protein JWQ87_3271 [Candidatus Sulfotelmatobacter sp.]|nr:hypothetical protein [Candidatus Sulfotelmatobacter sp.]